MRHLLVILVLLVVALICGALLSYPLYRLLQPASDVRFHKLISYVSTLSGLGLLCIWLKYGNGLNRTALGYARATAAVIIPQFLSGFLAGAIIIGMLLSLLLALGLRRMELDFTPTLSAGGMMVLSAMLAGTTVALLEETVYRGALLGGLLQRIKPAGAILYSSLIYAGVHFLEFRIAAGTPITWITGLQILPEAFQEFTDPAITDVFLSLLALGILLALARLKSGAIYLCIGLHAGIVAAAKMVNKTTDYVPGNRLAFLVSQHDHLQGYLALAVLAICILVYYRTAFAGAGPR